MGPRARVFLLPMLGFFALLGVAGRADAHKAGVSYSDITVASGRGGSLVVDYTLKLCSHALAPIDRDGDAKISEAELELKRGLIEKVLKSNLRLARGSTPCRVDLLDSSPEADGAWAVFYFTATCGGSGPLSIEYLLLATDAQPGYNLARITTESGYTEHIFTSEATDLVVEAGASAAPLLRAPLCALGVLATLAFFDPFASLWLFLLLWAGAGGVLGLGG